MSLPFSATDTSWIWRDAVKVGSMIDTSWVQRDFPRASSIAASTFGSDMLKGISRTVLDNSAFTSVAADLGRRNSILDARAMQIASTAGATFPLNNPARFADVTAPSTTSLFGTAAATSAIAQTKLFGGVLPGLADSIWKQIGGDTARLQSVPAANQWRQPETFAAATLLGETGTEVDALGSLWTRLSREDRVLGALDGVVGAVASRGPLGIDFEAVHEGAERLAFEISELDVDERHAIEEATEEAADATHTAAPAIRDHAAVLGLARFAQAHRSEIGIITGFTVGLTYAVMQLGAGVGEPATYWEAAAWGGATYGTVRRALRP